MVDERKCKRCSVDISHMKKTAMFCGDSCAAIMRHKTWYQRNKEKKKQAIAELFPNESEAEKEALDFFELIKWHETGKICPHCYSQKKIYRLDSGRLGLHKCAECRKQFTCKHGTFAEDSRMPYRFWKIIVEEDCFNGTGEDFCRRIDNRLWTTRKTSLFIKYRLLNEQEFIELKKVKKTCDRLVREGQIKKDSEGKYYSLEAWEKKYGRFAA